VADIIQLRRDTLANWTSVNPILAEGEIGYVLDGASGEVIKIGDGITAFLSLPYLATGGSGGATDFIDLGDVPSSYTGQAGKSVVVNNTEDGLIFTTSGGGGGGDMPTGGGTDAVFYENDQIVTFSYTLTASKNAGSFGTIHINDDAEVTIPDSSSWTIV
jgi:hypothetical protein